jgi:predicted transcriptional regulator
MEDILKFVQDGWRSGKWTAAEIARRTGRHRQTVHKALAGEVDPPHSVAVLYHQAVLEIIEEEAGRDTPAAQEVAP